jgi:hypothetical protein
LVLLVLQKFLWLVVAEQALALFIQTAQVVAEQVVIFIILQHFFLLEL